MQNMLYNSVLVWTSYRHAYMARKTTPSSTVKSESHTCRNYSNLVFLKSNIRNAQLISFVMITLTLLNSKAVT